MSVTLDEIAKLSGVSKATVSRALRNDRLIHSDTRSLVLEAAARAGYERSAKKSKKSFKQQIRLLFLLPPHTDASSNYIFQSYLRGLTRATGELGCLLSVEEISEDSSGCLRQRAHLPRELKTGNVNAVIVASRHNAADIEALSQILPVVSIQWNHGGQSDLVSAFNSQGVEQLTNLLIERGHRRLAWVGSEYRPQGSFLSDRRTGFVKALIDHDLDLNRLWMFEGPEAFKKAGGVARLKDWKITGIVCANDLVAHAVGELVLSAGLRIPEDIGITGFDADTQPLSNGKILTSYDPCFVEVSRKAAYVAVQRLKDLGAPRGIYLCEGRMRAGETASP